MRRPNNKMNATFSDVSKRILTLKADVSVVDKILGLTFFRQEKSSKDSKGRFPFTVAAFCARWIVYNSRLFA